MLQYISERRWVLRMKTPPIVRRSIDTCRAVKCMIFVIVRILYAWDRYGKVASICPLYNLRIDTNIGAKWPFYTMLGRSSALTSTSQPFNVGQSLSLPRTNEYDWLTPWFEKWQHPLPMDIFTILRTSLYASLTKVQINHHQLTILQLKPLTNQIDPHKAYKLPRWLLFYALYSVYTWSFHVLPVCA